MAVVPITVISFLADFGDFVTGDSIYVYAETDEMVESIYPVPTGIHFEINGVPETTGGPISLNPEIVSTIDFDVKVCVGNSLARFNSSAASPYAEYTTSLDNSCVIGSPVCDLVIVGTPIITPASDNVTADGAIQIVATSTNSIKYKLNSDFNYTDGFAQTSNTFSNLLPGEYRVYLRDQYNCAANILVQVNYQSVYDPADGVLYRLDYTDSVSGFGSRIDIIKRNYSGSVTEVKGSSAPFIINLRGEGVTSKYEPLLAVDAEIAFLSETDRQFIDLYTNDRNLYRLNFYKDYGSGYEQELTLKILPYIYTEPVSAPPYITSFRATDGLPDLKNNLLYNPDGQKFYGTVSLIKLVAYCLSFLKLDLNIRVAVNLYADTMDETASDDPLDQAYVDYECFYLADQTPDIDFVLRHILKTFGARITQWNNVWNIVRVDEMAASYDYREFDYNGDYVSNSSYNPVKNLDYPSANQFMFENAAILELKPGYGKVKVKYSLGLKPNIINNGDFRLKSVFSEGTNSYSLEINKQGFSLINPDYPLTEGYELLSDSGVAYYITAGDYLLENTSGGQAYLQTDTYSIRMGTNNQLKINIRYKVSRPTESYAGVVHQIEARYVKIRIRVKYGSLYLQSDGTWTSTETILVFFTTSFNEFLENEIVANQPTQGTPVYGMDFEIRVYHAYAYYTQFQTVADLVAFPTHSGATDLVPTGYKTELRDDFTLPSDIYYYELEGNTSAASGYDIVRPDDYHAVNNPRQWILKLKLNVGSNAGSNFNVFPFYIDRLRVTYLTDKEQSIDTVIREASAEAQNPEILDDKLIIGSYSNIITTEINYGPELQYLITSTSGFITSRVVSVLAADLIYCGWLRNSSGTGYEYWSRDGITESDKLHGIWLKMNANQYSRTWNLLRGTLVSRTGYFSTIDCLNDVNDSNKKYIPISLSINDRMNMASGEFLELITGGTGDSGSGFNSAFSTAYGNNFD